MQTSLTVALQQLGFDGTHSTAPYDAFKRISTAHVMAVARECKLHILLEIDPNKEIDDEEKMIIVNRALMHHGVFIDRVRPELDNVNLTASAANIENITNDEPGWRLEPMP